MSGEGLSDFLTPEIKLEELESKLAASDNGYKEKIIGSIVETQDTILPMRLLFNDFVQTMSNADHLESGDPKERFTLIRNKVLELSNKLQEVSEDFNKLQPLFETIPEYSVKYGNKKYQPLETLKSSSYSGIPMVPSNAHINTNVNPASHSNGINSATIASKKPNKSNVSTPINVSTPGSLTPTSGAPATKKPRKPRQTKKAATTGGNSKSQSHPAALAGSPPTNGMGSTPNSSLPAAAGLPTTNMMNSPINSMISPLASASTAFGVAPQPLSQPQSHAQVQQHQPLSQPQQQRPQQQFNAPLRNNAVAQSHLNLNNITPANILSMSLTQDGQQQPQQQPQQQSQQQPQQQSQQQSQQPQHQHQQPPQQGINTAGKDFDPLDFNNFDLWNLNMDMI